MIQTLLPLILPFLFLFIPLPLIKGGYGISTWSYIPHLSLIPLLDLYSTLAIPMKTKLIL